MLFVCAKDMPFEKDLKKQNSLYVTPKEINEASVVLRATSLLAFICYFVLPSLNEDLLTERSMHTYILNMKNHEKSKNKPAT